eukprot:TRINITY_DN1202_c1_g2_i2.p1 TRINITY_DN1202_c1_g2~~TRINITY_DN1202_c1_g2_i2.p1  ORF type:complete len:431 (+),score=94.83 TRINITY_DN1202_c1_g2_i2:223-1515(+)
MDIETYGITAFMVTEQQQQQMERELQSRGGMRDTSNSKTSYTNKAYPRASKNTLNTSNSKSVQDNKDAASSMPLARPMTPNSVSSNRDRDKDKDKDKDRDNRGVGSRLSFLGPGGADNPFMLTTAAAEATAAEITANANANAESLAASTHTAHTAHTSSATPIVPQFPSRSRARNKGSPRVDSGFSIITEGAVTARPLTSASKNSNYSLSGVVSSSPPPKFGGFSPPLPSTPDLFDFSNSKQKDNIDQQLIAMGFSNDAIRELLDDFGKSKSPDPLNDANVSSFLSKHVPEKLSEWFVSSALPILRLIQDPTVLNPNFDERILLVVCFVETTKSVLARNSARAKIDYLFDIMDTDGDGSLTDIEFDCLIGVLCEVSRITNSMPVEVDSKKFSRDIIDEANLSSNSTSLQISKVVLSKYVGLIIERLVLTL